MGMVTQGREDLKPENTVYKEISDGVDYIDVCGNKKKKEKMLLLSNHEKNYLFLSLCHNLAPKMFLISLD